ncbi:deoxyribonuclease-2-beta-like [Denticeps clupeoides]|uniref:deoxyribonuclease-2-beta-like n=1 Tax=Denticeps clupeoides TaxID=299321 RepID=UPI0010A3F6DD|nr:deoxyribonuclease-2-beta-like [Denticeps clupeoides]
MQEFTMKGYFFLFLSLVSVSLGISFFQNEISCLNEKGEHVDWFLIYKLPKFTSSGVGSGLNYMYTDAVVKSWVKSTYTVNSTEGALGRTFAQLYQGKGYMSNSTAYILYNDGPPELKYLMLFGHTKGALYFDKSQGFWISHTVPHFPPFPERGFDYPSSGRLYGQTALCITFKYQQLLQISQQLAYYNPRVYNCSMPAVFQADMVVLGKMCEGVTPIVHMNKNLEILVSAGGELFCNFAKSQLFDDDIYTGWVAQELGTDLLAETWQRFPYQLAPNCSLPKHVFNVQNVSLPGPVVFWSHNDHSKWCVSWKYGDGWACLGDLNREATQAKRGGGLLCTQNPAIYSGLRLAVGLYDGC